METSALLVELRSCLGDANEADVCAALPRAAGTGAVVGQYRG